MLPLKQIWTTVGVVITILACLGVGAIGYFSTQKICQFLDSAAISPQCSNESEFGTLPPTIVEIPEQTFVEEILGVQDFIGARGQYVTTYKVQNDVYTRWIDSVKLQNKAIDESTSVQNIWNSMVSLWSTLLKSVGGDAIDVHLEGEVLMAFDVSKLEPGKTVVVTGKHVTITLDGPYILTTHIYESKRQTVREQALWLAVQNDETVELEARKQQDAELIKVACDPNAKTKDGKSVASIQKIAKEQVSSFLKRFIGAFHPDYVVDIEFQNESCTVDTVKNE